MPRSLHGRLLAWLKNNIYRDVRKVAAIFLFILGTYLAYADYSYSKTAMKEGIERNAYGQGELETAFYAQVGDEARERIKIKIQERAYTQKQLQDKFSEIIESMDQRILGENKSLDHVSHDLNLISQIEDEPIDIFWETDRYDVIDMYGKISEENVDKEGTPVSLKGILTYRDDRNLTAVYECTAVVYPVDLKGKEKIRYELVKSIEENDEKSRTQERVSLPEKVGDQRVYYRGEMEKRGIVLCVMAVLIFILIKVGEKENIVIEHRRRREQMLRDYPEIINKLTLLLGAGMTVKKSLRKIVSDYDQTQRKKGERYAYEELRKTIREMDSGATETESYENLGRRTDILEYMRFSAMLVQNMKKGTKGLNDMLKFEAIQACENRKALARKMGEEAGTKLLVPMFMMLAIVLVIVMVPAFLSLKI